MKRITPRTCLWPLAFCISATFALSIGLTYRSDHHCYAGTCGEWIFPLQARLHVVVWYVWLALSVLILGLRVFKPTVRSALRTTLPFHVPLLRKQLRIGGVLLVFWILTLYGILLSIWWIRLRNYFALRGSGLPGNSIVAAIAQTGHLADVTMGMVLLPVSRHSALASFFKLSPTTTFTFHMVQAIVLFALVLIHAALYARWVTFFNRARDMFRPVFPVLNPTYLHNEVWPGSMSSLGIWRASLIFTGITASLIMVAMFLTSFPVVRRNHFNLFYFTHLLGIVAVIVICLHASTMFYCTAPGLSMWVLDWGMRFVELRHKLDSRLISLGNGWYCLTLPLPRKRLSGCACHSPLAHFYIHHSESSIREIHPFTTVTHLASQKTFTAGGGESIDVQFLFRKSVIPTLAQTFPSQPPLKKSTQWTNKLASLVEKESIGAEPSPDPEKSSSRRLQPISSVDNVDVQTAMQPDRGVHTNLRLEGPYFTPATPSAYKTVVCFVAGTGLSGAIAIASAFAAERKSPSPAPIDDTVVASLDASARGMTCTLPPRSSSCWDRCIIVWSVRERDYTNMLSFESLQSEGLEFRVHLTGGSHPRLNMGKILGEVCTGEDQAEGGIGSNCWCYLSGPNGFIDAGERACREVVGLTWFAARWD